MLSTSDFSLINVVLLTAVCLIVIAQIAFVNYVGRKFRQDFPEKEHLNRLAGEVSDLSGETADLRDRFSRFQKREDLRGAREVKKSQAQLQQEALELVNGAHGAESLSSSPKAELYKRARRN